MRWEGLAPPLPDDAEGRRIRLALLKAAHEDVRAHYRDALSVGRPDPAVLLSEGRPDAHRVDTLRASASDDPDPFC